MGTRWNRHNQCFWAEIRKIRYTPVNPSFTILKWGFRGSKLYWYVFVMNTFLFWGYYQAFSWYGIYSNKYNTLTPYRNCPKIELFHYTVITCRKTTWMRSKQCRPRSDAATRRLISVYTVCSGLYVRLRMVNMVIYYYTFYAQSCLSDYVWQIW